MRRFIQLLLILTVLSFFLHFFWLHKPQEFVFDEGYYVNASRKIISEGVDPNKEHPALAKLVIASSIYLLGDSSVGWRFLPALMGTALTPLMYLLTHALTKDEVTGLMAAVLVTFESFLFVHGRMALLEIPLVFFAFLGFYLYFKGHKKLALLSAVASGLCKTPGVLNIFVIILLEYMENRNLREALKMLILGGTLFLLALTPLSLLHGFTSPIGELADQFSYHSELEAPILSKETAQPWTWFFPPEREILPYYVVTVTVDGRTFDTIRFLGKPNFVIWYMAIPALLYMTMFYFRERKAKFILTGFAVNYLFYVPLVFVRILYLFYILPLIPFVAIAMAMILRDGWKMGKWYRVGVLIYFALVLVVFAQLFPFKMA
jgi:dolichyl-phosphate-mannose-protein mannosyltransferase